MIGRVLCFREVFLRGARPPARALSLCQHGFSTSSESRYDLSWDRLPEQSQRVRNDRISVSGGALALVGACMLGYEHAAALLSLNVVGGVALASGLAAVAVGQRKSLGLDGNGKADAAAKFKLSLLNRNVGFHAERAALEKLMPPSFVGTELGSVLQRSRSEADGAALQSRDEWRTRAASIVRERLAAGDTAERSLRSLRPRTFVLDFDTLSPVGGVGRPLPARKAVARLADAVTFVLAVAEPGLDEVVLRITSPGGGVAEYGLAAAHVMRLRAAGVRCVAAVDVVAASGGYMLAVSAAEVVAAPFSFVGSIGVVAALPNLHKVLKKNDVDFLQFTAGEYKRTVTVLGEVREADAAKFQGELEVIHERFKEHIADCRPALANTDDVATGEAWLAHDARRLGLVDRLATSEEVLQAAVSANRDVILIEHREKRRNALLERFEQLAMAWLPFSGASGDLAAAAAATVSQPAQTSEVARAEASELVRRAV